MPGQLGTALGGGGSTGTDPFAHSGSLDGLPLQPPGPIQPGGFHDHGGFGSNAFGAPTATFATGGGAQPPVGASASVMPPSTGMCAHIWRRCTPWCSRATHVHIHTYIHTHIYTLTGNPFADEPPPAFASSVPAPPTGAYAAPTAAPTYGAPPYNPPPYTNGTGAPPPAFAAPTFNAPAAPQPPPMFPMAGAQPAPPGQPAPPTPQAASTYVPPVATGPPQVPKDAFDEIVTARVNQQQQGGGFGSSPSYGGFGGGAPPVVQTPSVYPALYGSHTTVGAPTTQPPTSANPFGGPAPAWSAPPTSVQQTTAQQPATPDPFDSLVTLR